MSCFSFEHQLTFPFWFIFSVTQQSQSKYDNRRRHYRIYRRLTKRTFVPPITAAAKATVLRMSSLSGRRFIEGHTRSNQQNIIDFVLKTPLEIINNNSFMCFFPCLFSKGGVRLFVCELWCPHCCCYWTRYCGDVRLLITTLVLRGHMDATCKSHVCVIRDGREDYSPEGFKYHFN